MGCLLRPEHRIVFERLRQVRKSRSLSQGDVASAVGVRQSHYSQIENGMHRPSVLVLAAMQQLLDLDGSLVLLLLAAWLACSDGARARVSLSDGVHA